MLRGFHALVALMVATFCVAQQADIVTPPPISSPHPIKRVKWAPGVARRDVTARAVRLSTYSPVIPVNRLLSDLNMDPTWSGDHFESNGTNEAPAIQDSSIGTDAPPLFADFAGFSFNGNSTPDTHIAAGPGFVVQVANSSFSIKQKGGVTTFSVAAADFLSNAVDQFYSARVIFDPWSARWFMIWHCRRGQLPNACLVVLVSDDSDPNGNWNAFTFPIENLVQGTTTYGQGFELGYGLQAIYASGDLYQNGSNNFVGATILTFNKSELLSAGTASLAADTNLRNPDGTATFAPRAAAMQALFGGYDAIFVNSRAGGGNKLTVWKMRDPLGAHVLTATDIPTFDYTSPYTAVQVDGSNLDTQDCRLTNCVVTSGEDGGMYLFTGLQDGHFWQNDVAPRTACHMFVLNPVTDAVRSEVIFGALQYYYWLPSAGADFRPSCLWAFERCGTNPGQFAEIRYADWNQGLFTSTSSAVHHGGTNYTGYAWGRYDHSTLDWGDYFGPTSRQKIWISGEYATANESEWGTWTGASAFDLLPGSLTISQGDIVAAGNVGGPFTPATTTYNVSNTGEVGTDYEIVNLPPWLTSPKLYDEVPAGQSRNVQIQFSAAANSLPIGTYTSSFSIRDALTGQSSTKIATVKVAGYLLPTYFLVFQGSHFAGSVQNAGTSDNQYISFFPDTSGASAKVSFLSNSPLVSPPYMDVIVESKVARAGISQSVALYSYVAGAFETLDSSEATTIDTTRLIHVTGFPPSRYINPSTKQVVVQLLWVPVNDEDPAQDGWLHYIDYLAWYIKP